MKKKHILLAEDEAQTRFTLSLLLKNEGYRVTAVADGWDALQFIEEVSGSEEDSLDLLVLDVQMPRMTGLELLDKLHQRKLHLPALVITGYGNKEMVVELMRRGCADYLDKPFEPDDLLGRVFKVLQHEEMRQRALKNKFDQTHKQVASLSRLVDGYKENFEKLRKDMDAAVTVHEGLTGLHPEEARLPVAYRNQPLSELGGDLVHIEDTETGCMFFVADVSGHDMGASYHSVLIKQFLAERVGRITDAELLFRQLNKALLESGKVKRMVTACLLHLDFREMRIALTSAGAPEPVWLEKKTGKAGLLPAGGSPLGLFEHVALQQQTFAVTPGDRLFLYTDGIPGVYRVEGSSGRKLKLGEDGLLQLVETHAVPPLAQSFDNVWQGVLGFCRHKPCDDMLLLGLEIGVPE